MVTDQEVDQFFECLKLRIKEANEKYPDNVGLLTALSAEAGEVADAFLKESEDRIFSECLDVAAVAFRLAIEGDDSASHMRLQRGLPVYYGMRC